MSDFTCPLTQTTLTDAIIADEPHWARQAIKAWDKEDFKRMESFVTEKYWSCQQSINVFEVVGTTHPDYQGWTWIEFLSRGERMKQNLLHRERAPTYYLDGEVKLPTMHFVSIDNSGWYVKGDGNHRTCIARFMFQGMGKTMIHGVTVETYHTSPLAMHACERLRAAVKEKKLPLSIESRRKKVSREDTGGWTRERFEISICIRDSQTGAVEALTPPEALLRAAQFERQNTSLLDKLFARRFG